MMETLYISQRQCQVIKDPEKTQDPAGIRTQDLLITSQTLTQTLVCVVEFTLKKCTALSTIVSLVHVHVCIPFLSSPLPSLVPSH